MFNIKKKKKGLTLIETLVSLVILSFVITPMLMIVSSSRNTNRNGEIIQKNIYILQKYAEKFKREDVSKGNLKNNESFIEETFKEDGKDKTRMFKILTPTASNPNEKDKDIPEGYKVKVSIEALDSYKFPDETGTDAGTGISTGGSLDVSASNNGYDSIKYDAKINIVKHVDSEGKIGIQVADLFVEDKDGHKQGNIYAVNNNYVLEITNEKENSNSLEDKLIINLKNNSSENIIKTWTFESTGKNEPNNASVIVQVDSNEEKSSDINLPINCYNKIKGSNMSVYLAKSKDISTSASNEVINCFKDKEGNSLVWIKEGTVYITDGIYNRTDSTNENSNGNYSNETRLYKIIVSLYKDNQNPESDKPIQQVTSYKTVNK